MELSCFLPLAESSAGFRYHSDDTGVLVGCLDSVGRPGSWRTFKTRGPRSWMSPIDGEKAPWLHGFERRYGPIGKGFIHVHHKKPIAAREVYRLDPVNDLVPVCPNCHSMLHTYDPPLLVEQLKEAMAQQNSG